MNVIDETTDDRHILTNATSRVVLNPGFIAEIGAEDEPEASVPDPRQVVMTGHTLSSDSFNGFIEECAKETLQLLELNGVIDTATANKFRESYHRYLWARLDEAPALDILGFLVQPDGKLESIEDSQNAGLDQWSGATIEAFKFQHRVPKLPFINQTRPPALYKEVPDVYQFCQRAMCPVIQAQQSDLLTIASINPLTAVRVADAVAEMVEDETGRPPIWFGVVSTAEHWRSLNRKHFGL